MGTADLPAYAVAMMLADKDLAAAIEVFDELARQASDIEASEGFDRASIEFAAAIR